MGYFPRVFFLGSCQAQSTHCGMTWSGKHFDCCSYLIYLLRLNSILKLDLILGWGNVLSLPSIHLLFSFWNPFSCYRRITVHIESCAYIVCSMNAQSMNNWRTVIVRCPLAYRRPRQHPSSRLHSLFVPQKGNGGVWLVYLLRNFYENSPKRD